jgi:hypothetical protein
VLVIGSDATSLSSGIHHYLKYVANCSISWWGDQLHNLQLSPEIPLPSTPIRQTTSYAYRYYMNVCTVGYSTWAWDWDRWEREIDWMALHAINAPLAFTGQEWVFLEVSILNIYEIIDVLRPHILDIHKRLQLDNFASARLVFGTRISSMESNGQYTRFPCFFRCPD